MKLLLFLFLAVAVQAVPCKDKQQCASCHPNGRCSSKCYSGYYGYHCKHRCSPGCKNNVCHFINNVIDKCLFGCKVGFYGNRCHIPCDTHTNTCMKCPKDCEGGFCQLESSCAQGCQDSYYGTSCKSCPAGCEVCDRVSGTCEICLHCEGNCTHGCLEGCKPGYFGDFCEHTCKSGCLSGCDQTSGDCFKCKSGWFGASCENRCPKRCVDEECDMNGICSRGCTKGWFGVTCKEHCPHKCMVGVCDIDGNCTSGCTKGWFGQTCEARCSKRCFAKDCDQVGICTQGCKDGWYGPHCESNCTTGCRGETCARNGICLYGCKVGFYGLECETQCSASCLNKVCDDKDGSCRSCEKAFYGGHCNKSCLRCYEGSCRDACQTANGNIYEGDVTSHSIPYIVAAVVVVIVSALVTYAACRFKRLQSVIYGSRRGEGNHFQPQIDPTEEAAELTVNFYCELDEDASRPPRLPMRCGTEDIASPISNSQEPALPSQAEQRDDTSNNRDEATPNSPESDSPVLAEHHGDASVHNIECKDVCVAADLVLHVPSRANSYLTAFAEEVYGNEGMQVDVHTEQDKDTRSDTRSPEMVDMRSLTRSQGDLLSVPSVYPQASGFDAGSPHITTETQNDCDSVTSFHINDLGFDEVPFLHGEPKGEGFTGSDGYARDKEPSTTNSHVTAESPEDDNELTTISVPVIADCYDNFPVDGEEEAIPNPAPDNYSKLFTTNYVRK